MVPILSFYLLFLSFSLLVFPFDTASSLLSLSLCFFDSCWLLLYVLVVVVLVTAAVVGCSCWEMAKRKDICLVFWLDGRKEGAFYALALFLGFWRFGSFLCL